MAEKSKFNKFITLLAVLLFGIGNVWADTELCSATLNGISSNSNTTGIAQTGCTMKWNSVTYSGSDVITIGTVNFYKFSGSSSYVQLVLTSGSFQAGDELTVTLCSNAGSGKTKSVQYSLHSDSGNKSEAQNVGSASPTDVAYTLVAADIESDGSIKIFRGGNTNIRFGSFSVTRAGSGSTDPVSSVSVAGATTGYATVPVALTATPDETATGYKWFVDGVEQDGKTSATFNFEAATPGTYSIVAKARNDYNATDEWIASDAHTVTVGKLCGELVKIVLTGNKDGNVSGILTGTKDVSTSTTTSTYEAHTGYKLGSNGQYVGITGLSKPLRAGDVVTVYVTTVSANLILYSDKGTTKIGEKIGGVTQGANDIVLTSAATGKTAIYLYRVSTDVDEHGGGNMNPFVHSLSVNRSCEASTDCSISDVTINSEAITPVGKVYSYEVPAASALTEVAVTYSIHPLATASPASGFTVAVPTAGDPANTQTITVTAEDGTHSDTYTISVSKATAASDVVTLDALAVTDYTLSPTFDPATLAYTITKGYGTADPTADKVTYTKSEEAQTVDVTYDGTNHKFVVTVKAEDNTTTQDYEITINEAEAKRDLLEVVFSNGAKGAINAGTKEIRVPYIGSDAPTFVSAAFASWVEEGASAVMDEGKLKVTGADSNYDEYTIVPVQLNVAGVALDEDITFDGVPAYIFAPYGWDSGKGVKFAKNQEQEANRRISSGNSRIYIAVPTGVAYLQLTSGSAANRNVVIKVNGVTSTVTKTAAANSAVELAMDPAIVNFVYIENNSGSGGGDAGFIKMHLVPAYSVTYSAGEGSVKSGETLPTQASVAAGTEITLAMDNALEKDGYDFDGWLCDIDAVKYAAGAPYTMTAAPTTFTAQWVLHVVPVDPTLTYDEGAYTTGGSALDLSSLITAKTSTGAITYSVKTDGGTGAAIDGNNFTATAAGTATITASQAAVSGYNAKSVDFNVVVTEPAEKDGIKLVEAGALTGNFRIKADQLKSGSYIVDGISYTKYIQMGSTHTSFSGETEGSQTKGIYYAPTKKNITFWFYMRNTDSSARKIYIYKMEEGSSIASETVTVDPGSQLVSYDMTLTTNAEVIFGVENTKLYFCQIVAVESGDALLQGGEAGYVFDYSKKRQNVAANTLRTIDGIEYKLSAEAKINSASNVQLQTLGTHYIKFHLDNPMTVNVYSDNKKYYIGSECSTEDAAKLYESTGDGEFSLAAGDWYINGSGVQVKINKLEFALPKAEEPTITTQPASNHTFGPGNLTATVEAEVSDGGTLKYQWYKAADDSEVSGQTTATLTTTTEGTYYVIVTNSLAGHQDSSIKSDEATLAYRDASDATLSALSVSNGTLDPTFAPAELNYRVDLSEGTVDVPTLTATATMAGYASVVINNATAFVNYEAVSTVTVTSEDFSDTKVYTVHFYVDHAIATLVDVTDDITWDFSKANDGSAATSGLCNEEIFANVAGIVNNGDFESDNLIVTANKFADGKLQASMIKFHTTVDGLIKVIFSHTGNNKTDGRALVVNGTHQSELSHNQNPITYYCFVPAGDVVLTATTGDGNNMLNFTSIKFMKKAAPDHARDAAHGDSWMAPGELGTICLEHGAIATGGDIFELVGKNAEGKVVFATVSHMEPGKPYLFESKSNAMNFYYTDETPATEPDNSGAMKGSFIDDVLNDVENVYYFSGHALWRVSGDHLNVVAHRAYVQMDEVDELSSAAPAPGRRYITMNVHGQNQTTGIEDLMSGDAPMKVLIEGTLFILRGEKVFDATGHLVK